MMAALQYGPGSAKSIGDVLEVLSAHRLTSIAKVVADFATYKELIRSGALWMSDNRGDEVRRVFLGRLEDADGADLWELLMQMRPSDIYELMSDWGLVADSAKDVVQHIEMVREALEAMTRDEVRRVFLGRLEDAEARAAKLAQLAKLSALDRDVTDTAYSLREMSNEQIADQILEAMAVDEAAGGGGRGDRSHRRAQSRRDDGDSGESMRSESMRRGSPRQGPIMSGGGGGGGGTRKESAISRRSLRSWESATAPPASPSPPPPPPAAAAAAAPLPPLPSRGPAGPKRQIRSRGFHRPPAPGAVMTPGAGGTPPPTPPGASPSPTPSAGGLHSAQTSHLRARAALATKMSKGKVAAGKKKKKSSKEKRKEKPTTEGRKGAGKGLISRLLGRGKGQQESQEKESGPSTKKSTEESPSNARSVQTVEESAGSLRPGNVPAPLPGLSKQSSGASFRSASVSSMPDADGFGALRQTEKEGKGYGDNDDDDDDDDQYDDVSEDDDDPEDAFWSMPDADSFVGSLRQTEEEGKDYGDNNDDDDDDNPNDYYDDDSENDDDSEDAFYPDRNSDLEVTAAAAAAIAEAPATSDPTSHMYLPTASDFGDAAADRGPTIGMAGYSTMDDFQDEEEADAETEEGESWTPGAAPTAATDRVVTRGAKKPGREYHEYDEPGVLADLTDLPAESPADDPAIYDSADATLLADDDDDDDDDDDLLLAGEPDKVLFSPFAPSNLHPTDAFTLSIFAFLAADHDHVVREAQARDDITSGPQVEYAFPTQCKTPIYRATPVTVVLRKLPDVAFRVRPGTAKSLTQYWLGEKLEFPFKLEVLRGAPTGIPVPVEAHVVVGRHVTVLHFALRVQPGGRLAKPQDHQQQRADGEGFDHLRFGVGSLAKLECRMSRAVARHRRLRPGQWTLTKEIGEGNFGRAFLAELNEGRAGEEGEGDSRPAPAGAPPPRTVVVKMLKLDGHSAKKQAEVVKEFNNEVTVMSHVGDVENVVPIVGACHTPGSLAIVTEYYPGGSLDSTLRPKQQKDTTTPGDGRDGGGDGWRRGASMTSGDRLRTAKSAARGMRNLHACGVVHRDLAARNCLLGAPAADSNGGSGGGGGGGGGGNGGGGGGDVAGAAVAAGRGLGEVAVADFGLSCVRPEGSYGGGVVNAHFGHACWLAPEQCAPPYVASLASDAYSFGVLLWEIYSPGQPGDIPWAREVGKPWGPRTAEERKALIRRVLEGQRLAVPSGMPDEVAAVMRRCFEADPYERPAFADICKTLDGVRAV